MTEELALLRSHIGKRRTFAIISHPDAGKTTLTEKLLLYGGAIHLAGVGEVTPRSTPCDERLDGARKRARHLDLDQRSPIRFRWLSLQPPRHARSQRLQRRHVPHARGRRLRGHVDRLREGRRAADDQALRSLSDAQNPDRHVHQQARSPGQSAARSCSTRSNRSSAFPARR